MESLLSKNKIAFLIRKLGAVGGVEKYARFLAEAYHKEGWDVTVLTSGNIGHLRFPFQTIPFVTPSKFAYRQLKQFDWQCLNWLKEHPVNVVFGMDRNSYQTHYRAGNGVHAAYLNRRSQNTSWWKKLSFKFNPLHRTILHFEKQTYENPETRAIFTNSQMVKEEILRYYRTDPNNIHVVHNGVQWQEWEVPFKRWNSEKEALLKKLKLSIDRFHFVFIGNEYRRKGLPQLLKALSVANNPNLHLSVIGKERNLKFFYDLANQLNLATKVTFFGPQNSIIPFYQIADSVVIPSTYDPFANVTVEALAMGCFVLSSNQNGGSEILTPSTGMILNNIDDAEEFANKLNDCSKQMKTLERSSKIRNQIKHLDFKHQLRKIISQTK